MKQFIKNKKLTYNLMSLTAFKTLVFFTMLVDRPISYQEISDYFFKHPLLREKISIDTFRVYINSFKKMGCDIKRIKGKDKISRYKLLSHPFELKIADEQISSITRVYRSLLKTVGVEDAFALDNFFNKVSCYANNDKFTETIKGASLFKMINKELFVKLIDCCENKDQVLLEYYSPHSGYKDIEILADKLGVKNGKIYLKGVTNEYKQEAVLPVFRIKQIKDIRDVKTISANINQLRVVFEYRGGFLKLDDSERLIKQDGDISVIEVVTSNKFQLKQRLLEMGPSCKILEPEEFKVEFVELLKDMKAGYYCD